MRKIVMAIATMALSLVPVSPLSAQRVTSPTLPTWIPRGTNQYKNGPVNRADEAVIEANLAVVEGLFARISGYAKPRGFEVRPWWAYSAAESRTRLSEYTLSMGIYVPSKNADPDGNGASGFTFNPDLTALSEPSVIKEENGGKLYVERLRSAPILGSKSPTACSKWKTPRDCVCCSPRATNRQCSRPRERNTSGRRSSRWREKIRKR
jgi:hypothetical protein